MKLRSLSFISESDTPGRSNMPYQMQSFVRGDYPLRHANHFYPQALLQELDVTKTKTRVSRAANLVDELAVAPRFVPLNSCNRTR